MSGPNTPMLVMKGITKRFPGVTALYKVDFEVLPGEIHGLLGENGAGKTTLMNILYGIYKPDEGEIVLEGERVEVTSPKDAIRLGIGMVPQHFRLVMSHSVLENVVLGMREYGIILRYREAAENLKSISERYGFNIDPNAKVWQLTTGERQYVELLKVLMRDVKLLILDEPTTVLTPHESEKLFEILKLMREEGKSVIFITHKLREALSHCDRITVLRKGRVVATVKPDKVNEQELAKMMVGEEIPGVKRIPRPRLNPKPVLDVVGVSVMNDKGLLAVRKASLRLYPGEILGIAGITGSGQEELAEAIAGLRRPVEGRIYINGHDVTGDHPRRIFELGVAYIPKDRLEVGILPNLSIWENIILRHHRYPPIRRDHVLLDLSRAYRFAEERVNEYNIVLPDIRAPARVLSGGNMQKLVLARELAETSWRKIKLVVAVHPTRGLDVKAADFVRRTLLEQRERGAGILLISEDLDEIMELSDRIAVMHNGEIVGVIPAEEATARDIGLMMSGVVKAPAA